MGEHRRSQIPETAQARLAELPALLKAERTRRGLSMRQASAELGLGTMTVQRMEQGKPMDLATFLAVVAWLQLNLGWFVGEDAIEKQDAYRRGWDDCAAAVRAATAKPERDGSGT